MATSEQVRTAATDNAFSWRFVTPMFLGSSLNPVNSSLIATALVPIAAAMHISVGRTAALVSSLYLASSIAQPTAGKLSEEFGPRRVFLSGILLVLAGGLVGGFAQDLTSLIVARVLIGVGTSAGYPSAMLLIRRRAEQAGLDSPPGSVLGGLVIAGMVTPAVGLPLGGVLVGAWGWRTVFFVNVPLALIALTMAVRWIPRDPPRGQAGSIREVAARLDVAGIVGFGGALAALLVFLLSLPSADWIALIVAVVVGALLTGWELRASRPFFDVRLLARNLALTRTYLRWAVLCLCIYTVLYGVTEWLQAGRGLSPLDAGLLLLPMSAVGGVIARPVSQRNLLRTPLVIAAAACLAVPRACWSWPRARRLPGSWSSRCCSAWRPAPGPAPTRRPCTPRSTPGRSGRPPACCGRSATSGRSRPRRSSRSPSAPASATMACTSPGSSWSRSAPWRWS